MLNGVRRVHVIACGVLGLDLRAVADSLDLDLSMEFLPGGLHREPLELRRRLQEAIDRAADDRRADLIAIGYGVCGLGAVDIKARAIPLAIPRVNDCIALFLGSDKAYRDQFAREPGTYYIADGWVAENSAPPSQSSTTTGTPEQASAKDEFQRLVEAHGEENAEAIRYFLSSWQRNYRRAAYIDTGLSIKRRHADMARDMAERFGWKYEELRGTPHLLESLLTTRETSDEILIVPPHYVTAYDASRRTLAARPAWQSGPAGENRKLVLDSGPTAHDADLQPTRVGLGIDAGGTFTDVVIYDFASEQVLQKAKAPTTPWDYTIGINQALDQLDPLRLAQVDLVSVSTTLATNAIVEGRGQKVGLLIWPPYGQYYPQDFSYQPLATLRGQLEINGAEIEAIDAGQIAAVARQMVERHQVKAFAVTGFASHANPSHELAAKKIIRELTHMPVTCGHEVSEGLSYIIRAETAMLNSRIIPYLQELLEQFRSSLQQRQIDAPIMVVRSDGSLMSVQTALEKPIETILSGPAASVAGGRHLAGVSDAIVVDIGGTTTDTAIIADDHVRTCPEGARVGKWRTHVKALDMRTMGLGGDSLLAWRQGELQVGPRRVVPIGSLAGIADPHPALDWVERHLDHFSESTEGMCLLRATGRAAEGKLDVRQQAVLDALARGPRCLHELSEQMGCGGWQFLPIGPLEDAHMVQRCGLTPTDLLHVGGLLSLWPDLQVSTRLADLLGRVAGIDRQELARRGLALVVKRLTLELIRTQLAASTDQQSADAGRDDEDRLLQDSPWLALIENLLAGGSDDYHVRLRIKRPLVGIGAPVGHFLPQAAERLETEAIVPPHAEVANAVGAITSLIVLRRQVQIVPDDQGRYRVEGLPGARAFRELEPATEFATSQLQALLLAAARANGTSQHRVEVTMRDRVSRTNYGGDIFICRLISASLSGRPDLSRLTGAAMAES